MSFPLPSIHALQQSSIDNEMMNIITDVKEIEEGIIEYDDDELLLPSLMEIDFLIDWRIDSSPSITKRVEEYEKSDSVRKKEYRQRAILRYLDKRTRRKSFTRRYNKSKAKSHAASLRCRDWHGRMISSKFQQCEKTRIQWLPITAVSSHK